MRGAVICVLAALVAAPAAAEPENDYPTEARADYVFGCMAANGQTRELLHKCACSLDVIASILPYDVCRCGNRAVHAAGGGPSRERLSQRGQIR
jgi:hypothetical protein